MFSSFSCGDTSSITTGATCFFRNYLRISKNRTFECRALGGQEHPRPRSITGKSKIFDDASRQNITRAISRTWNKSTRTRKHSSDNISSRVTKDLRFFMRKTRISPFDIFVSADLTIFARFTLCFGRKQREKRRMLPG